MLRTGSNDPTSEDLMGPDRRILFGTRFLFRQQVALGLNLNKDWAVELFFEHLSNANLSSNNEGADSVGFRIARKL